MHRRRFLELTTCITALAGLAGCSQSSEPDERSEDEYWSEGTSFLSIHDVDAEFSGTLRVVPSCRDEAVDIQITDGEPHDSIPYSRQDLGEGCSFDLYIDDEKQESLTVKGTERCEIMIDADGTIESFCEII